MPASFRFHAPADRPKHACGRLVAFLDRDLHGPGTAVEIDTGKGVLPAAVSALPFYKMPKPA